jgi:hypothetical protein
MSYATVAARNVSPSSPQPRPDPALLNTGRSETSLPDVDSKVNVVPSDFKLHPATETSETEVFIPEQQRKNTPGSAKRRNRGRTQEVDSKAFDLWQYIKTQVFHPGVAGGLIGIANVGIIAAVSYELYTRPSLRINNTRALSTLGIGTLILVSAEGLVAERYSQTEAGRHEAERAKEEGIALYARTKDLILRPGVLGGLVGVINVGILGGIGYIGYQHWNTPHWDRQTVSLTSAGVLALFAVEGALAERYVDQGLLKHK